MTLYHTSDNCTSYKSELFKFLIWSDLSSSLSARLYELLCWSDHRPSWVAVKPFTGMLPSLVVAYRMPQCIGVHLPLLCTASLNALNWVVHFKGNPSNQLSHVCCHGFNIQSPAPHWPLPLCHVYRLPDHAMPYASDHNVCTAICMCI